MRLNGPLDSAPFWRGWTLYIISVAVLAAGILIFLIAAEINYFSLPVNILIALADSSLILLPLIFIPGNWRWTVGIPMLLIPPFLIANAIYWRNFSDLISIQQIFSTASYNEFVLRSGIATMGVWEWIAAILWWGYFLYFIFARPWLRGPAFSLRSRLTAAGATLLLLSAEYLVLWRAASDYFTGKPAKELFREGFSPVRQVRLRFAGLPAYLCFETAGLFSSRSLSDAELQELDRFFARTPDAADPLLMAFPDSNSRRNLIMVVVESWNSSVIGLKGDDGASLFPYLDSLVNDPGVIAFRNMRSQVGPGRSSDGNLIYFTGLLPLTATAWSTDYAEAEYPSLARLGWASSAEMLAEDATTWNHARTNRSFGYGSLHQRLGGNRAPGEGADSICFDNALRLMCSMPQPFLVSVFTIDMHDPYDSGSGSGSVAPRLNGLQPAEACYLYRVGMFERGLARFISGLKRAGLYDRSVIVIVSDHEARRSCLDGVLARRGSQLALLILNSGLPRGILPPQKGASVEIAQADVYPSLLDLTGRSDCLWRGFGRSVFRNSMIFGDRATKSLPADYPGAEAWRLSSYMIIASRFPTGSAFAGGHP